MSDFYIHFKILSQRVRWNSKCWKVFPWKVFTNRDEAVVIELTVSRHWTRMEPTSHHETKGRITKIWKEWQWMKSEQVVLFLCDKHSQTYTGMSILIALPFHPLNASLSALLNIAVRTLHNSGCSSTTPLHGEREKARKHIKGANRMHRITLFNY